VRTPARRRRDASRRAQRSVSLRLQPSSGHPPRGCQRFAGTSQVDLGINGQGLRTAGGAARGAPLVLVLLRAFDRAGLARVAARRDGGGRLSEATLARL